VELGGDSVVHRYKALLDMADLLVHHGNLPELFHALGRRLHSVVSFDFINFSIYDSSTNRMRLNLWEGSDSPPLPMELPLNECASGWVWENQQPLVFDDITLESGYRNIFDHLKERGIRSYCMLPLTTSQARIGGVGIGSRQIAAYGVGDLELLQRIAGMIALAVENFLTRQQLTSEKERLDALLRVNSALLRTKDMQQLIPAISESIHHVSPYDYATLDVSLPEQAQINSYPLHEFTLTKGIVSAETRLSLSESPSSVTLQSGELRLLDLEQLQALDSPLARQMTGAGIQKLCCIPLLTTEQTLGCLTIGSADSSGFTAYELDVLRQFGAPIAVALENARAYREIADLKDKLAKEKIYLEDEIRSELNFEEIVGESPNLKGVLEQVGIVAPSDASVLILGETGTGKELVARAIHNMSARRDASFIKVNCAAIPSGLLESELFGHERGAFTGAIIQKVGRMELSDKGTLFLDEVGDIPLELQPKLLRALQDQEFERLGSTRTIKVNARIIAATNKNLALCVAQREFRSDLFYRLSVFPVTMPPLRERRKDIPLLVRYFVQRFARRMNKRIETISTETMGILSSWDWPGNVRELENFIERSVILSRGNVLTVPVSELKPYYETTANRRDTSLEAAEREHILRILRESSGVIAGTRGAAARLGLKRTTLQSKMQKLGISRRDYEN